MKRRKRSPLKVILYTVTSLAAVVTLAVLGVNVWVVASTADRILSEADASELENVDCIVVLGCGVRPDGSPSDMLADRLKRAVALYDRGAAPKVLMSGDHGTRYYNEVDAMKRYALEQKVPTEDVFLDHAGFSTYETVYRAKEIFRSDRVIIVTQKYHLSRALYIARAMGMDAYGVAADYRAYSGQLGRDIREVLARVKDAGMSVLKPKPTYLGEVIPITGNGMVTHDEESLS